MGRRQNIEEEIERQLTENYKQYYRLAFSYVKNEQDALDIVQEGAYKAIKNSSKVKERGYIATWIYRIIINTSLDFLRRQKPETSYEDWEGGAYQQEEKTDIMELLEVLDKKEKAIIILRYFEDRKLDEIAAILDENLNTVKAKLYRSLKKMKAGYEEEENGGSVHVC